MYRILLRYFILIFFSLLLINCSAESSKPIIVATSFPAASIIKELTGNNIEVKILVPAGASPHTYAPKPSDIKLSASAVAFFSIADNLDGWSKGIKTHKHFDLISFLPDSMKLYYNEDHNHNDVAISHTHNNLDPHFWFDPLAVKSLLTPLSDSLRALLPQYSETIKNNTNLFAKRLDLINKEVSELTRGLLNKPLFLQHPSFLYFAKRYRLDYLGSIEETPGKEPGPKYIANIVKKINESGAIAIFTEPQLNKKVAEVIADESGVLIYELDPIGGTNSISNYSDLMLYNTKIIAKALGK